MKVEPKRLLPFLKFLGIFVVLSMCGEVIAMNNVAAELKVYIKLVHGTTYVGTSELVLCIGNRCYPLLNKFYDDSLPGWRDVGSERELCLISEQTADKSSQSDHPFVDNPDDWDQLLLKLPIGSYDALNFEQIIVTITGQCYDGDTYKSDFEYDFVNKTFVTPFENYNPGAIVPLYKWVKKKREKEVLKVLLEYWGVDRKLIPMLVDLLWEAKIFDHYLPWMVREAAYDIGQAGIWKYAPERGGNGCDEAYYYLASQYSNNISNRHKTSDSLFEPGLGPGRWKRSGRAAKVNFIFDNTGLRIGLDPNFPVERISDENWAGKGIRYNPKPGDFFLLHNRNRDICNGSSGHVMMALGTIRVDPNDNHIKIPVIEKVYPLVQVVWKDLNDWGVINDRRCSDGGFTYDFYFGEVDNEQGGSQIFNYNDEEIPNYGFRAWLPVVINN